MKNIVQNKICRCDRCGGEFERKSKWVGSQNTFSQINSVSYWTEGKGWNIYNLLCRRCLKEWFEKEKISFNELLSLKKKRTFYAYYYSGRFDKEEGSFFNNYKKSTVNE